MGEGGEEKVSGEWGVGKEGGRERSTHPDKRSEGTVTHGKCGEVPFGCYGNHQDERVSEKCLETCARTCVETEGGREGGRQAVSREHR